MFYFVVLLRQRGDINSLLVGIISSIIPLLHLGLLIRWHSLS